MRLAEALVVYLDARNEREAAIAVGYDYARVGRAVKALLAAQAGLLARCAAELPALLAVVEAAEAVMCQSRHEGRWLDTPAYSALTTLDAALGALDQRGEEGTR